jgi:hypothetical protein
MRACLVSPTVYMRVRQVEWEEIAQLVDAVLQKPRMQRPRMQRLLEKRENKNARSHCIALV